MNMPGFTAETALYREAKLYRSKAAFSLVNDGQMIIPQMVRVFRGDGITLVCVYDDSSGALGYCDVYF